MSASTDLDKALAGAVSVSSDLRRVLPHAPARYRGQARSALADMERACERAFQLLKDAASSPQDRLDQAIDLGRLQGRCSHTLVLCAASGA